MNLNASKFPANPSHVFAQVYCKTIAPSMTRDLYLFLYPYPCLYCLYRPCSLA